MLRKALPLTVLMTLASSAGAQGEPGTLNLPDGFHIEKLPFSVPNARQMAMSEGGRLVVGTRREGAVYVVDDPLGAAPSVRTLVDGLNMPSGVTIHDGDLYIGAVNEIMKIENVDGDLDNDPVTITDTLPDKRHHGWKYLKFSPDGTLYVPVGAPCNICLSKDERFATILTMDTKTGATEVYAHGVRNTVGFDWHPVSGALWFSDNGRDMLGDDVPPEEINIADRAGAHFGYPFVHADDIQDPEFGDHKARQGLDFVAPAVKIQAHSAALGMTFYTADAFPKNYENALFVAEHGSWNRSSKVGYLVSVVTENPDGTLSYAPFITGWLVGEDDWGRPNDVLVAPDGSLLISDDKQGVIYRVTYQGEQLAQG